MHACTDIHTHTGVYIYIHMDILHIYSINVCVCLLLKTKTNQHTLYIAMFQSLLLCNLETTSFVLERYVQYHLTARCWLVCGLIHEGGLAWTSIVNSKQSIESTHTHICVVCVFPNWKCTSYFGNLSRICLCFWGSLSESKLISTHLSHDIICTHKQYTVYIYIIMHIYIYIYSHLK